MSVIVAKWTIDEYHRMIEAGILSDRKVELYPENIFWLIEYANSSLEKDLEIKSKIYAQAGISEYWVVNLKKLNLVIFRDILDGEYATKQTLTMGIIQPLAFPDIDIDVEKIINN